MSKTGVAYSNVREPHRAQSSFHFEMPEDLIPEEHPARLLWNRVGPFDLSPFLAQAESAEGVAGRAVLSPQMKLTLWLYAISDGVGSAREIAERIKSDLAYRWIVGDRSIGHHALSAFRAAHTEAFDLLFTEVVSQWLHRGPIDLAVMGRDGTRVRGAASAPSFRSLGSLLACRQQAVLHLKAVLAQADDPELRHAQRARRVAAAKDCQQRVEAAIAACKAQREAHPDSVARGSTTQGSHASTRGLVGVGERAAEGQARCHTGSRPWCDQGTQRDDPWSDLHPSSAARCLAVGYIDVATTERAADAHVTHPHLEFQRRTRSSTLDHIACV
jgi:transposase